MWSGLCRCGQRHEWFALIRLQGSECCAAGFPLTDKLLGRAFTVISGHDPGAIDWVALRGFETLVFLMAGYSLPGARRVRASSDLQRTLADKAVGSQRWGEPPFLNDALGRCDSSAILLQQDLWLGCAALLKWTSQWQSSATQAAGSSRCGAPLSVQLWRRLEGSGYRQALWWLVTLLD